MAAITDPDSDGCCSEIIEESSNSRETLICPLCDVSFRLTSIWGHINNFHIAHNCWHETSFLDAHNRLICNKCKFCYDKRWYRRGCRQSFGSGRRCGGHLCHPSAILIHELPISSSNSNSSDDSSSKCEKDPSHLKSCYSLDSESQISYSTLHPSTDNLLDIALEAVSKQYLAAQFLPYEADCVYGILNSCLVTRTATVTRIPRSCHPLVTELFLKELRNANKNNIWGGVRLLLFAKCTLRSPCKGCKRCRFIVSSLITKCLQQWLAGEIANLWYDVIAEGTHQPKGSHPESTDVPFLNNVKKALYKAREGLYGKAIKLLKSTAITSSGDLSALNDLSNHHPQSEPLDFYPSIPSSLVLDCNQVLSSLQSFPKSSSPGGSQLHAQHLYDIICGCVSPAAQECLIELTLYFQAKHLHC